MEKLKNISKMDYPEQGLHGYYVRIQRDGKQHARMFSVTEHGSKEQALSQAIAFRDSVLERWQQFCGGKDKPIQYQSTNTGYPGISLSRQHNTPVLEVNLPDPDGTQNVRTITLPAKGTKKYERVFQEQFEKAKAMVDEHNRKRFGGRWYQYKKRKELID